MTQTRINTGLEPGTMAVDSPFESQAANLVSLAHVCSSRALSELHELRRSLGSSIPRNSVARPQSQNPNTPRFRFGPRVLGIRVPSDKGTIRVPLKGSRSSKD